MEEAYFKRRHFWSLILTGLAVLLIGVIILCLNIGPAQISPLQTLKILANRIPFVGNSLLSSSGSLATEETIIIQVRMPRVLSAAIVGAALATAGVTFQGILRNPMADPYVIGVSSGAGLGASLAIVLGLGFTLLGGAAVPALAFAVALVAIFVAYGVSRVGSRVPVTTLLLSGIAISIILSAVIAFLTVFAGEKLHALVFWLMGSFSYAEWRDIQGILPLVCIGVIVIYMFARDLNIMQLDEDTAKHLGVEVERVKKVLIIFASLITAAAVSISGLIGFVGLIIPHLVRILVGPDHRVLIPASLMTGAVFLALCDAVARVALQPAELPVGVITAFSGGPFFIYLLRRRKGKYMF